MTTKVKKSPTGDGFKLDLEPLSSSLRHSWHKGDVIKATAVLSELSQQYPDLLVTPRHQKPEHLQSCYDTLKLGAAATQQEIIVNFFKQLRRVLKDRGMSMRSRSYVRLLNAAFVLRKPRLRLSHDLAAVSSWLKSSSEQVSNVPADQAKTKTQQPLKSAKAASKPQQPARSKLDQLPDEADIEGAETPLMLRLLEQSHLVSEEQIAALHAQMKQAPDASLDVLLADADYISVGELASVKLGELLVRSGQISLPQIVVALYDERTSGIRMAESLQTRGWLPVQVE